MAAQAMKFPGWPANLALSAVFANRDYEPAAKQRDAEVAAKLAATGIAFQTFKDQAIFDGDEVLTQAGQPFSVFTPYKNAWLKRLTAADWTAHRLRRPPCRQRPRRRSQPRRDRLRGNRSGGARHPSRDVRRPAPVERLPRRTHRALWRAARFSGGQRRLLPVGASALRDHFDSRTGPRWPSERRADTWLSELIWRDFYFMILDHFPQVVDHAFKPEYDAIQWAHWPEAFRSLVRGANRLPAGRCRDASAEP